MLSNTATRSKTESKGNDEESAHEILSRVLEAMHITDVAKDNAALVKLIEAIQVADDARIARDKAIRACDKAELKERRALNDLICIIMPAKVSKALSQSATGSTTKAASSSSVSSGTPSFSSNTPMATKATSTAPVATRAGYVPTAFAQGKATPSNLEAPPDFEFLDGVETVKLAWQEYTVGLGGRPAVRDLEARWGSAWRSRKNSLTSLIYERRTPLYRFVEDLQKKGGLSAEEAVRRLDMVKRSQNAKLADLVQWITDGNLTVKDLINS